jgi:predicted dehydrogenase
MSAFGLSPRAESYYRRNNWAGRLHVDGRPVLDSPVNNAMAHYLQWLLFIGGASHAESLIPIQIEAELYRANPIESPDTVNLRLETSRGIDVRCAVSHASNEKLEMEIVVEGDKGSLTWRQNGKAEFRCLDGTVELFPIPTHKEMQTRIIERITDFITTGNGFICTPEHAELHTRCIVAAHDAAEVIPIPDRFVNVTALDGSPLRYIEGIREAVRDASMRDLSFHALGIPWATKVPQRASMSEVSGAS